LAVFTVRAVTAAESVAVGPAARSTVSVKVSVLVAPLAAVAVIVKLYEPEGGLTSAVVVDITRVVVLKDTPVGSEFAVYEDMVEPLMVAAERAVKVLAVPWLALRAVVGVQVMVDGAAIVILSDLVLFPALLDACTVKVNVPAAVGVPEITPALDSVSPVGKLPLVRVQVIGVVPLADRVWE